MGDWTRVVVGIDGSDNCKSALQWAAEEARTHGAELTVVSVWAPLVVPGPHGNVGWATQLDPEAQARDTLQATLDDTLGGDPGVGVRREVRGGNAAKVLIDLSKVPMLWSLVRAVRAASSACSLDRSASTLQPMPPARSS